MLHDTMDSESLKQYKTTTSLVIQVLTIQQSADGVLDLVSDTEIEINATTVDINANVEISGTATTTGVHTFTAVPVFPNK